MTKKSTAARAAKSKTVLVATQEIHGGTEKGGTHVLSEGSELTDDQVELLGLDDDAVSNLTARGILIERRLEWMASSILRTGSVTIVGDDYPSTVVNFNRTGSLTKTLTSTARWGENGVEPFTDVETWIGEVASASGAAVNIVVMDAKAWGLFIAGDPAITTKDSLAMRAMDRVHGQNAAINLGLTPALPGSPVYKGNIGDVEFYVYNDKYEADTTGTVTALLPDYTVILGSQGGVEGAQLFGSILDPRNNYGAARYFPKDWIEEDPAGEFVMTQSAPILAPKRVDATLAATVR